MEYDDQKGTDDNGQTADEVNGDGHDQNDTDQDEEGLEMDPEERDLRDRIAEVTSHMNELRVQITEAQKQADAAAFRGFRIPEANAKAVDRREKEMQGLLERQDSAREAGEAFAFPRNSIRRGKKPEEKPKSEETAFIKFTVRPPLAPEHDDIGDLLNALDSDDDSDDDGDFVPTSGPSLLQLFLENPERHAGINPDILELLKRSAASNPTLTDKDKDFVFSDEFNYDNAPADDLQAAGYDNEEEVAGFGDDDFEALADDE